MTGWIFFHEALSNVLHEYLNTYVNFYLWKWNGEMWIDVVVVTMQIHFGIKNAARD